MYAARVAQGTRSMSSGGLGSPCSPLVTTLNCRSQTVPVRGAAISKQFGFVRALRLMHVHTHRSARLVHLRCICHHVPGRRRQRCRDTERSFRYTFKHRHTISKATPVGDLALINVDYISPSLWLGVVLGITGMVLYSLKFRDARGTTEGDIVAASLFVMCGGILTLQGWRLDPILMLSEFVLGGVGIFYMVQTVNLRKQLEIREEFEQEQARSARWSLPRQQTYENVDEYDQLTEGIDMEYSRKFQQRFQSQPPETQDDWRQDSAWPRARGRSVVRYPSRVSPDETWSDEYDGDVPYGVDTSSPKGRVSPESWKARDH